LHLAEVQSLLCGDAAERNAKEEEIAAIYAKVFSAWSNAYLANCRNDLIFQLLND